MFDTVDMVAVLDRRRTMQIMHKTLYVTATDVTIQASIAYTPHVRDFQRARQVRGVPDRDHARDVHHARYVFGDPGRLRM